MAIYCTKCGKECSEDMKFCTSCGSPLKKPEMTGQVEENLVMEKPTPASSQGSSNKVIWIVVALLLILIVVAIAFVVMVGVIGNNSYKTQKNVVQEREVDDENEEEDSEEETTRESEATTESEEDTEEEDSEEDTEEEITEQEEEETTEAMAGRDWVYTNARFGYSALIPASFSQSEEEPANGDGAWFFDEAGASLTVSGYYNVLYETPDSIVNDYSYASYTYVGDDYCCISFVEDESIVYIARHVDEDMVYGFEIVYPRDNSEDYDLIIEEMLDFLTE